MLAFRPLLRHRLLQLLLVATTLAIASPRLASAEALLLIEADSGKVLQAENATYPWYPASVTKLMTAYVTLKAVKEGKITLDTLFTVSPVAASQSPSKMGFRPGTQVTVDNALKMMMVKSANDIAVVLAEGVSGSIDEFAAEMNRTSARLGMTQSSWVNPNGLPAEMQITSARDMAILARTLMREFPEYDLYWHIPAIKFGKRVFRNYNKLIDRYPGADGMKTGFICASGYNMVASATRNGRRLIAVVLGSSSGTKRAETAAGLLEKGFSGGGGLSWLLPSLGSVDSLKPVVASPPDLRDEICGKGRRARTDHAEEEEQQVPPVSFGVGQISAAFASAGGGEKQSLLGPLTPSMPPIPVSIIPVKGAPAEPAEPTAKSIRRKGPVATAKSGTAKVRKSLVIDVATEEKPARAAGKAEKGSGAAASKGVVEKPAARARKGNPAKAKAHSAARKPAASGKAKAKVGAAAAAR